MLDGNGGKGNHKCDRLDVKRFFSTKEYWKMVTGEFLSWRDLSALRELE